jgi:hypothetical protein
MRKKLLSVLFILGSLVSLAEENLTIHDLKMKMELDKSKPNHIVVNIVPDDTEERIEAILKKTKPVILEKKVIPKDNKKIVKNVENKGDKKVEIIKKEEKIQENIILEVSETMKVEEEIEIPKSIEENSLEDKVRQPLYFELEAKDEKPLQDDKMPLGVVASLGAIIIGVILFLYGKYKKK